MCTPSFLNRHQTLPQVFPVPMLGVALWKTVKPLLDGSTAAKVLIREIFVFQLFRIEISIRILFFSFQDHYV